MLDALGRRVARRARLVLATWAVLVVVGFVVALSGVAGPGLFDRLSSGEPRVPSESQQGRDLLADADAGPSLTLLVDAVDPADPATADALAAVRERVEQVEGVVSVVDPTTVPGGPSGPAAAALVAADGRALLVDVALEGDLGGAAADAALQRARTALEDAGARVERDLPGARTSVGGVPLLVEDITRQVEVDLRTGEGIALPLSLAVMVAIFGGLLAAGMPVVAAVASIAGALVSLLGFSYALDLDASVVNVVTVLGLGLSIDYGLLLVSRFREELRAQPEASVEAAVGRTLARAGRTVVFSAVTVAISLSGLLLFEADILRAVGAAGVSIVAVALLVTLTLVPALLALAGRALVRPGGVSRLPGLRRLSARFGDVAPDEGAFSALARRVQRRPLAVLLAGTAVLLLLAVPVTRMELRASGVELLPPSAPARVFFDTLGERFPATRPATAVVVADAPPEDVAAWAQQVRALDGVSAVDPVQQRGDYAVLGVRTAGDPVGARARELVEQLRAQQPGFRTWVTGQAAGQVDFTAALVERAPLAAGVVASATLVLLFLMTGSVLVPLKALVMNVVSLGASLGVLVWVFQDGHLEGLLGFTSAGGVESFVPPLVLALGFGLAMDYEVFLLARIKEARDAGWSDDEAVVHGLQRSGRIITSAALIIVIVFGGFVAGELLVIKQTGVALAVAVLIDASVVRCVLVPATMTLLGRWNWWAPRPLRELHARAGLQETWSS